MLPELRDEIVYAEIGKDEREVFFMLDPTNRTFYAIVFNEMAFPVCLLGFTRTGKVLFMGNPGFVIGSLDTSSGKVMFKPAEGIPAFSWGRREPNWTESITEYCHMEAATKLTMAVFNEKTWFKQIWSFFHGDRLIGFPESMFR